jgi:adenine-specific DNA methylase
MWAIEYNCALCKPIHDGRFFKKPDGEDLAKYETAREILARRPDLPIPNDEIPKGDETDRLHRWGYRRYREMFSERQLAGLGLLLNRICEVKNREVRHALLTVFSDFLRYQNMLCRYDTYALKCQDIFSVHGFPVGLVQCENNLLGIPRVGSGSFRHFVEKYVRAKQYCEAPFETQQNGGRKRVLFVAGEKIKAELVNQFPSTERRQAHLVAASATDIQLMPNSLDGVFTDPPYFANVQYAELMDFCFVWLRQALANEFSEFQRSTTRSVAELTGNLTLGRGIVEFTNGLSNVFRYYSSALKVGAPFVFTYHHNDPKSYAAIVVAVLDAGLNCTKTLPAAAEMSASLHIAGTGSSTLDSVFVCRRDIIVSEPASISSRLSRDVEMMKAAGVRVSQGDVRCIAAGHVARLAINRLRLTWNPEAPLEDRIARASETLAMLAQESNLKALIANVLGTVNALAANGEHHR